MNGIREDTSNRMLEASRPVRAQEEIVEAMAASSRAAIGVCRTYNSTCSPSVVLPPIMLFVNLGATDRRMLRRSPCRVNDAHRRLLRLVDGFPGCTGKARPLAEWEDRAPETGCAYQRLAKGSVSSRIENGVEQHLESCVSLGTVERVEPE